MAKTYKRERSRLCKIEPIVNKETRYHLQAMAGYEKCEIGRVIDKLVRDRRMLLKGWID